MAANDDEDDDDDYKNDGQADFGPPDGDDDYLAGS